MGDSAASVCGKESVARHAGGFRQSLPPWTLDSLSGRDAKAIPGEAADRTSVHPTRALLRRL